MHFFMNDNYIRNTSKFYVLASHLMNDAKFYSFENQGLVDGAGVGGVSVGGAKDNHVTSFYW